MWWSHETCCSDTTIGNERKIDKLLNHIYKKMILYVFSFFFVLPNSYGCAKILDAHMYKV